MPWVAGTNVTIEAPSDTDIAYLAGLLDGEGCIFANGRGSTGIQICMTDEEPIRWAHRTFSGNYRFLKRPSGSTWKDTHTWALQRQADLLYLVPLLLPYLKVKRPAAERLIGLIRFVHASKPMGRKDKKAWADFVQQRNLLASQVTKGP